MKISIADPYFDESDRKWIHRELDSILDGALSMGPNVEAFEKEFAEMVGTRYAIATSSCTAALEMALNALGVGSGSEVIIPAQTFIATGMAVHLAGGVPVFAEISDETFCLDLSDVKTRVNSKTRGIILVHWAGVITPEIEEFRVYCKNRKLFLLEDAAHSPGAMYGGRSAGSIGEAGCFSFYPTKIITSGEGGMLTTNNHDIADHVRSLRHRGRDFSATSEQYNRAGRNNRMTEMAALLGRVQLSHLKENLSKRRKIASAYKNEFEDDARIRLIAPNNDTESSYWKFPILVNTESEREIITKRMHGDGISVDWTYQPALHLQPIFQELYGTGKGQLPRTEELLNRHICLPCHPRMDKKEVSYVIESLRFALDAALGS